MKVTLTKSPKKEKKFRVTFQNGSSVDFGQVGYSDYTLHKDRNRMKRYVTRHARREKWGINGVRTAGFWSRWLLWSRPSLTSAKKLIKDKWNINM